MPAYDPTTSAMNGMCHSASTSMALLRSQLEHPGVRERLVEFLMILPEAGDEWYQVVCWIETIIQEARRRAE